MMRFKGFPFAANEAVVAHEITKDNMESKDAAKATTGTDVEGSPAALDFKTAGVSVYPESQHESRSSSEDDLDKVDERFQHGVQMAQAMTQVWTRNHLILAFVLYVSEWSKIHVQTSLTSVS